MRRTTAPPRGGRRPPARAPTALPAPAAADGPGGEDSDRCKGAARCDNNGYVRTSSAQEQCGECNDRRNSLVKPVAHGPDIAPRQYWPWPRRDDGDRNAAVEASGQGFAGRKRYAIARDYNSDADVLQLDRETGDRWWLQLAVQAGVAETRPRPGRFPFGRL